MGKKKNNNGNTQKNDLTFGRETMKNLLALPADYEFKIMGQTDLLDILEVVKKIQEIVKNKIKEDDIRKKESSKKKYTSYTVKVYLRNYEELEKIYGLLKAHKSVIYYL